MIKTIKNVLISSRDNKLKLCNILYDEKIQEIKFISDCEFEWSEIKQIEKRDEILGEFVSKDDCKNLILAIPGGVDPHVHFNTPGFEAREDFTHASSAAIFGGTTTVIDMPCTSLPPVSNAENFETKKRALKELGKVNSFFWGGVGGCNFDIVQVEKNINELAVAGVVGFKVYVISGMETFADLTYEQIELVAAKIKKTELPMAVHAEDKMLVSSREKNFKAHNRNDWKAYCESRDVQSELEAVEQMIRISEKTGCRVHIVHLSSALALNSIKQAQEKGICITTETCPHYLHFTQKDFENEHISAFLKTAPPVKFEEDKNALWNGLKDNSIEFVTTDHAGCIPEIDKAGDNFWKIYGGIPGVEHRVPFMLSEGFLSGRLSLQRTIELISTNASKFFNLKGKGSLDVGNDADLVLVDLWNSEIVQAKNMHSKGKYTPFEGVMFSAVIKERYLSGSLQ
ncbi:MAG: allantoinase [Ignavibacteria bacterium]|nr:MAG: allantoinase [Ignavibacteria bacterium]KAF0159129.1 MAG: allantoinase [Ignavibacteria bacterium]